MDERNSEKPVTRRQVHILYAIIGLLGGVLIGVVLMLAIKPNSAGVEMAGTPAASQAALPPPPERWFIWEGTAPLIGDSFQTEANCEQERRAFVVRAEAEAAQRLRDLPPMSIAMIRELGDPAEQIAQGLARIQRAYCRREA